MLNIGPEKLVVILVIVLVLFGGSKIPELMRGLGEGMREFKKATQDDPPAQPTVTTTVVPPAAIPPAGENRS